MGILFLFHLGSAEEETRSECAKRGARSRSERRQKRSGGAFLTRALRKHIALHTPQQARAVSTDGTDLFLFTTAAQRKRLEGECAKRGARSRSERRQKRSGGAFLTRAKKNPFSQKVDTTGEVGAVLPTPARQMKQRTGRDSKASVPSEEREVAPNAGKNALGERF